jgi:hypothetical protein
MAETVKEFLARIGRKGGKNRVKNRTPKELSDDNRRAAQARWSKQKKEKK